MRRFLISILLVSGCDLATEAGEGAVGGSADAGPPDLTPPDEECPAYSGTGVVCLGSFEVRNFADIELVSSCVRITGDLDLGANGLVEIELPLLERVDGRLLLQSGSSLERIALPELREVGGDLTNAGLILNQLSLTRLRTVADVLNVPSSNTEPVASLPCLDSVGSITGPIIAAPRLTAVTGHVFAGLQAPLLTRIPGSLDYLQGSDLPALTRVGDLRVGAVDAIALPALRQVDRVAVLGCGVPGATAAALDLPSLLRAGGFDLCPWPGLTSVDLPALVRILGPGGMTIGAGAGLGPVTAPSLVSVDGGLVLDGPLSAPALAEVTGGVNARDSIDLPALATVGGSLRLPVVAGTLVFPALTSVSGDLVVSDSAAVELRAPALTSIGGDLMIVRNPITDIELSSLASLGTYLTIRLNPSLPTCQAEALRDQLIAAGWTGLWNIRNNGTGTCP